MTKSNKFSPEVRERAVRMVQDHRVDYPSLWAAIESIAPKIGCVPQTLNDWVKKAEVDSGQMRRVEEERDLLKKPRGTLPGSPSEVPLHERAPSRVSAGHDVPGSAGSACRFLCLAAMSGLRPLQGRHPVAGTHPTFIYRQPWRLWRSSRLWRPARSRRELRSAPCGTTHAAPQNQGRAWVQKAPCHCRAAFNHRAQPSTARVHSRCSQQGLGHGHHLHPNLARLAVPGGGAGPLCSHRLWAGP